MSIISRYKTFANDDVLTAADWNGMESNLIDNGLMPSGIEDWSTNDAQAQTQTDPYPSGVLSRATALSEEIERIRFQINSISGQTYWYEDPTTTLSSLKTRLETIESDYNNFPSGTKTIFRQTSSPTGWSISTTHNDKLLRVVSSSGGGSGGTYSVSSGIDLSHSHTATHVHAVGSTHTHSIPPTSSSTDDYGEDALASYSFVTSTSTSGNTGGTTTASSSASLTGTFAYADVIVCEKNSI